MYPRAPFYRRTHGDTVPDNLRPSHMDPRAPLNRRTCAGVLANKLRMCKVTVWAPSYGPSFPSVGGLVLCRCVNEPHEKEPFRLVTFNFFFCVYNHVMNSEKKFLKHNKLTQTIPTKVSHTSCTRWLKILTLHAHGDWKTHLWGPAGTILKPSYFSGLWKIYFSHGVLLLESTQVFRGWNRR